MNDFRLHTPEELQKIAEEDFERFKEVSKDYYDNHWEYYLDSVIPVLLNVSKLNDSRNTFVIPELNKIGEKDYNKLQLIAKIVYKIDYEFYVDYLREILHKNNPQSGYNNKVISSLTESETKIRKYNSYYIILIVLVISIIISLAIYKYFYDIKILNEEIVKRDMENIEKEEEKIKTQKRLDSINKENKIKEDALSILRSIEEEKINTKIKQEQEFNEQKIKEENRLKQMFDNLDPLEKEIVQISNKLRQLTTKERKLSYDIKYNTMGADIQRKSLEYKKFAKEEYAPTGLRFSYLLTLYSEKHGRNSVRDLAVKWDFLDLLK
jgi:hypothetical protein